MEYDDERHRLADLLQPVFVRYGGVRMGDMDSHEKSNRQGLDAFPEDRSGSVDGTAHDKPVKLIVTFDTSCLPAYPSKVSFFQHSLLLSMSDISVVLRTADTFYVLKDIWSYRFFKLCFF